MTDPRFFTLAQPFSAGVLASEIGAVLDPSGNKGGDPLLRDVAPLESASPDTLSFLDNPKYRAAFAATRAGAVIVRPDLAGQGPPGCVLLLHPAPYVAYARAARLLYPDPWPAPHTHPSAVIDPSAQIGANVIIDPLVVIGAKAVIQDGCWIESGAVIGPGVQLGQGVRIGAGATVTHAVIGDRTRLYPGCRVGQDGFGFAITPQGFIKVPQLGRVVIGTSCEIGANTTIDRGANQDTEIGDGTWIDNLVQIGHNVKIGKGCVIVAQVGISGSTMIGDHVMIGGQAGIAGHVRVGKGARLAAQSGIMRDVPAGQEQMGSPALPIKSFLRHIAYLKKATRT